MSFLSFISRLIGLGRRFTGTPEQYLAMVQYLAFKNNPHYSEAELIQWGQTLEKVMKVNLKPYKNFQDLVLNGRPDDSLIKRVDDKLNELHQRKDLKEALYGPEADLGDDDVMKSNSDDAIFARRFVKDLSQHVQFPEGEQDQIDRL